MSSTWRPDTVGVVREHLVARRHAGHVDVARPRCRSRRVVSSGQLCTTQPRSSFGSPTVPISQSTIAASRAGAPCSVHHVGELVVAVHEAGDEVDRLVRAQPRRRLVEAGQLAALDALEERGPPVDLALVEAVGPAEVLQALGLPVDLRQQRDALDQLVGEPLAGVEVGVERRGPRRRSVPSATSRRRSPSGRRCGRAPTGPSHTRDRRGVGHVGAVERLDDPPLAEDAVVAVGRGASAAGCAARTCRSPRRIS